MLNVIVWMKYDVNRFFSGFSNQQNFFIISEKSGLFSGFTRQQSFMRLFELSVKNSTKKSWDLCGSLACFFFAFHSSCRSSIKLPFVRSPYGKAPEKKKKKKKKKLKKKIFFKNNLINKKKQKFTIYQ